MLGKKFRLSKANEIAFVNGWRREKKKGKSYWVPVQVRGKYFLEPKIFCKLFPGSVSPVNLSESSIKSTSIKEEPKGTESEDLVKLDPELERGLLKELSEVTLQLPVSSSELLASLKLTLDRDATHKKICNLLEKFAIQKLITVNSSTKDSVYLLDVAHVEVSKVNAMILECAVDKSEQKDESFKRKRDDSPDVNENDEERKKKDRKEPKADLMVRLCLNLYLFEVSIKIN